MLVGLLHFMRSFLMILFGVLWSVAILLFDGFGGYALVKQMASRDYSSTSGQIIQSRVAKNPDSEGGISYQFRISYNYMINGHVYNGKRHHYIAFASDDYAAIAKTVQGFPADSEVTVFYNPNNPGDSLLAPGLTGQDGFFPIFLLPFNVIMLFFWRAGYLRLHRRSRRPEAGGLEVLRDPPEVRLRLMRYSPFEHCLFALGCAGVLGIIIVGASSADSPTSPIFPLVVGLMILAVGLLVGYRQKQKRTSGDYDLIIDKARSRLILPLDRMDNQRRPISLKDSISVFVEKYDDPQSEGEPEYHNKLHFRNPARFEKLCHWLGPAEASELADWLSKELGVPRAPDRST